MSEPRLERGWVAPDLAAEFPELGLLFTRLGAGTGRTPRPLKARMAALASRFSGGHVVNMRQDDVPWAYRVFWRQIGIDPDTDRTPVEALAVERLRSGGLHSTGLLEDALVISTLETGVALVAFDADRVGPEIGLRVTGTGEYLGQTPRELSSRQVVYADEEKPIAVINGEVAEDCAVTRSTTRTLVAALLPKGVSEMAAQEALWNVHQVVLASNNRES